MEEHEVFGAVGEAGFRRLVGEFYKQVPQDEVLGPMYPKEDMSGAEARLVLYLIYRFGGPKDYEVQRGHPRLRMRHAPFAVTANARDHWLKLMKQAIANAEIADEPAVALSRFFDQMANFLINAED